MDQDAVNRIEEQIAHLARAIDDMSDILHAQDAEIARLKRLLGQLAEREAERMVQDGAQVPLADQKPPHW
ncbi:MAG: SlyX protein [Rhodobacteraceae bacterium HLUCCA12]|nr:MAG: SlyX protein [Rhodobacteraceae bacterium HLUCCA12]